MSAHAVPATPATGCGRRSRRCTSRSRLLLLKSLQAGEWLPGPGDPQRGGTRVTLRRQPGHGAQGHRRTGHRERAGAPPGQGHLRGHPCRAVHAVPLPAPDARRRRRPRRCSAACSSAAACVRRPRWRANWRSNRARPRCRCGACFWRRIRRACGPWCWTTSGCPAPAFKGLTAERLQAWRGPMYRLFEAEFAVHMMRAEEKMRAVAAGQGCGRSAGGAGHAAAVGGTPVLHLWRPPGGTAPRPVPHRFPPLPQRAQLRPDKVRLPVPRKTAALQ